MATDNSLRIGLLVIATGRYRQFLAQLIDSAVRFFFTRQRVTLFVFSEESPGITGVEHLAVEHEGWPFATLHRYRYFTRYAKCLRMMDYLFYMDVDMRFVGEVGEEILHACDETLVGVEHPGYFHVLRTLSERAAYWWRYQHWPRAPYRHDELPYERDPKSRAYLSDPRYATYFCGGFNGGRANAYLNMAAELAEAIDDDTNRGILAVWHDESHLNRYFHDHPPKRLSPAYCYPQSGYRHLSHIVPRILALDKDHAYFRGGRDAPKVT